MERNTNDKVLTKKRIIRPILQRSIHVNQMIETKRFTWKDIQQILKEENVILQDDDILTIGFDEGFEYPDNSKDPSYDFKVERPRLETDEEFERRKTKNEERRKENTKSRYEAYLKLKAEFENGMEQS